MQEEFHDKILICCDCGEEFVLPVSAQEFFAEKGYIEDPKRCKACYKAIQRTRRGHVGDRSDHSGDRQHTSSGGSEV